MSDKRRNRRIIEVSAGFIFLLATFSLLLAYMMQFNYKLPYLDFEDNFSYLVDNISHQKLGAWLWLVSGILHLILLPLYLLFFGRFQKGMHIFNSLLILIVAWAFFSHGLKELQIHALVSIQSQSEENSFLFLRLLKQIAEFKKIGLSAFGGVATVLSISRFRNANFPFIGSLISFTGGPLLIAYTWINNNHILHTIGLAAVAIGHLFIAVTLINRGMFKKIETEKEDNTQSFL